MVPVFSRTPSKRCSKSMDAGFRTAWVNRAAQWRRQTSWAVWAPLIGFAGTAPRYGRGGFRLAGMPRTVLPAFLQ